MGVKPRNALTHKLLWMGFAANLLDALTTFAGLTFFDLSEANPLMAILYNRPLIGYPLKLLIGGWIFFPSRFCPLYFLSACERKLHRAMGVFVWSLATSAFSVYAANNIWQIVNVI